MYIDIPDEILKSPNKIACIYSIKNIINGKVYIGQTTNIRKRASDYRHADSKLDTRPITLDIKRLGSDKFIMTVLEYCNIDKLSERENYYIDKLNTKDPKFGYNLISNRSGNNTEVSRYNKSIAHMGLKETNLTKRKKSNCILTINDSLTDIIISDSAKLFGDYIGESKSYIKALLRNPTKYKDIYCFYDDYEKRKEIRQKIYNKKVLTEDNVEYLTILDYLDTIELSEDVETIYLSFDIYIITYDNIDDNGKPIPLLINNGFSAYNH